ncbi:MAG TPA: peptide deformylase [bacterium]|nr:peptide deformylase [bacterium]
MTLRRIAVAGSAVLKKRAVEIPEITPEVRQLAADMTETLQAAGGLAIAAPQVGEPTRLVVVDRGYLNWDALPDEERKDRGASVFGPETLVNPEITSREGEDEIEEGCLSVPGYRAPVKRARRITYRWTDLDGAEHERNAEGLEAICIQHELDHLDGKLFIDRISRVKRTIALGKVRKYIKELDPEEDETAYRLYGES